ncbi:MAG: thiamine pyrophosphate-binding protein [Candidatus Eremiobacterota bacterium]
MTIAQYLIARLEELGLKHMFGVPGDYSMPFLDAVLQSRIAWVGTCNELNAGYAADGYAQVSGLGALSVTYDVGGFSAYNAVAGSYVERVPVVLISGAPPRHRQRQNEMMHHLVASYDHQRDIYARVTVAAEILEDPACAPHQIDRALTRCLKYRRPVYFELAMDAVHLPCPEPAGKLEVQLKASHPEALKAAVEAAVEMLSLASNPAVLVGCDVDRLGLHASVLRLLERTGWPVASTLDGVTAVPIQHPQRIGVYAGPVGDPQARERIEMADRLLCVGTRRTDITSGNFTAAIDPDRLVRALAGGVSLARQEPFREVELHDFVAALAEALPSGAASPLPARPSRPRPSQARLTSDALFAALDEILGLETTVVTDTGDALFQTMSLTRVGRLMSQGYYLSIGYATPAGIGAALAAPERRTVVVIGDGAFQMTAQEISTMVRLQIPMAVVLINNDGYVVERLLHHEAAYNDINRWRYADLPGVFGDCQSFRVETVAELGPALQALRTARGPVFLEAVLERNECGHRLQAMCATAH